MYGTILTGLRHIYLDDYNIQRQMNKQSGFNAEQINKDKNPESKNHLKIKSKIMSYHNKTKTVRLSNHWVMTREDYTSLKVLYSLHRLTLGCKFVKLTTRVTSQALNWEIFFYLYVFFPHWAHADSSFVGARVICRLVMYRTKVLMYRTMVLLASLAKVRR